MNKFSDYNKLHTFNLAAKHLSFSKAAKDLFVTQAAVSQQIRSLETTLGFDLFHRLTRRLVLTKEGEILKKVSVRSLDEIQYVVDSLVQDEVSGVLTISVLPSLAMKWLIPKLEEFNQQFPEINIHVHSHVELADFKTDGVDMAIRFGYRAEPKFQATFLMKEEIFLVASPRLATKKKPLKKVADLKKHVLLHDEIDCHFAAYGSVGEVDWARFADYLKIDLSQNKGLTLTQAHMVLLAAIEGQGVAIGRTALVEDDLKSGRLVRVFADKKIEAPGYHIVYPENFKHRRKIAIFEKWLLSQVPKDS